MVFLSECKVTNASGENGRSKSSGGRDAGSGGMSNSSSDRSLGSLFGRTRVPDFGVLELTHGGVLGEIGKPESEEAVEEPRLSIDLNPSDSNIIFGLRSESKVCNLSWFIVICCCSNSLSNKNCFSFVESMIKECLVLSLMLAPCWRFLLIPFHLCFDAAVVHQFHQ